MLQFQKKTTFATLTVDDLTVNNNLYSKGNTEVVDLALKGNRAGDIAQTVYVGIRAGDTCPSSSTDNILLRTTFTRGGYIGWVKTNEANAGVRWKRWGKISHECNSDHYVFDKIGIGVTYCADQYQFQVTGISTFNGNVFVGSGSSFIGAGTIPVGGIIMWSGTIANIPTGWALCDGTTGTPDLRDRFIVGAGNAYSPGNVGGANSITLDITQIPSHNHTITDPGHFHYSNDPGIANNSGGYGSGSGGGGLGPIRTNQLTDTRTTGIGIGNTGGGQSHENRPPYYALAFIMRTL